MRARHNSSKRSEDGLAARPSEAGADTSCKTSGARELPPSSPQDREADPDTLLALCSEAERRAVLAALKGDSLATAAAKGGWTSTLGVAKWLSRPRVKAALLGIAPLLPDAKHAGSLLSPYLLAGWAESAIGGSPQERITARDRVADLAGLSSAARSSERVQSLADVVRQIQREGRGVGDKKGE